MSKLKDSERMLAFLNDLSKFTQTFSSAQPPINNEKGERPPKQETNCNKDEKNSQSPTTGIANEFIEQLLENYFQKNVK
ncbi:MAG: hypothetical protein E7355_01175 [Clostridiales bacterium]|nr:hypothetical protein [Clostridiales bacterium]